MAQVAYAWVASRPGVTAPIVGISKPEQFTDAIAALDLALDDESVIRMTEPYRPKAVAGHI
jgi:aryl-alcohol dehydrogenase-like predicted oxidoreductase